MDCLTLKKSNCKNCYKCIRHCPVKSIRFSGNQAYIIGNECIMCGHCFVVCPQDAKQIVDETEKVKVLLQSGDPVIVSLAPSFVANYEGVGIESMREALKNDRREHPRHYNHILLPLGQSSYTEILPGGASLSCVRAFPHAGALQGYKETHSRGKNRVRRTLRRKKG